MNKNKFSLSLDNIKEEKIDQFSSKFVIDHLPATLAITIGNSLRRLAMQFVSGWAMFAIKISNGKETINNELNALDGVVELPNYLISGVEKLVVCSEKEKEEEVQILEINIDNSHKKEAYKVKGKDVKGKLKVVNPDIDLFEVSPNSKVEIYLYYRYYWGNVSIEEQRKLLPEEEEIIFLDNTDYCPVKSAGLGKIEDLIVSLNEKEERIPITITTNGSIKPKEALIETLKIWQSIGAEILKKIV